MQEWKSDGRLKQKFVFRGAQGFLVPGYIEFPNTNPQPWRLVLLLHGWSGGKEDWYNDDNYINGGVMRKALLGARYAVLALDAATHGERSNEIDYQHVNPFDDPKAPARRCYFTYAEVSIQTVKDYRRALDFIFERGLVATNSVGLVGYSMGGAWIHFICCLSNRASPWPWRWCHRCSASATDRHHPWIIVGALATDRFSCSWAAKTNWASPKRLRRPTTSTSRRRTRKLSGTTMAIGLVKFTCPTRWRG